MAMLGTGCFVAWYNLRSNQEDHDLWHTHEHMIERLALPGFLRGLRYHSLSGSPQNCVIYHVESLKTFTSPAYLERLNNPTPWSVQVFQTFRDMNRTLCTVIKSYGAGVGAYLLSIQLSPVKDQDANLRDYLVNTALPSLSSGNGLCGAHLLLADPETSKTPTREEDLRGRSSAIADWIILIEGHSQEAISYAESILLESNGIIAQGAHHNFKAGRYCLHYLLDANEVKNGSRIQD